MKYLRAIITELLFTIECRRKWEGIFHASAWERFPLRDRIGYWMEPKSVGGHRIYMRILADLLDKCCK